MSTAVQESPFARMFQQMAATALAADEAVATVDPTRLEELRAEAKEVVAKNLRRQWLCELQQAGVPRAVAARVGTLSDTEATTAAKRWASGETPNLMLRGGVGCGKTLAALAVLADELDPRKRELGSGDREDYSEEWVLQQLVRCHLEGRKHLSTAVWSDDRARKQWLRPEEVISAVLHSYDPSAPKIQGAGWMVVIDDVGMETKPGFEEALCVLLDEGDRRIVMTTNLTQAQFKERYGARLRDRLNHTCMAVDIAQKSMRKQTGGF